MFKRFGEADVSSNSLIKSSVARGVRTKLLEQYPAVEPYLEDILPKKANITMAKCAGRVNVICKDATPMFFQDRDGPIYPTLRLLHQYPTMMPVMQVDKGAIDFVMNGANIMCRGFTSPGGRMDTELGVGQPVAIFAEGKRHALAIGLTKMSTADIASKNTGIGVDSLHVLDDGLWNTREIA